MAERTRLDHETILRVVRTWPPEAQRGLAWPLLRDAGTPPSAEPPARPATTGCQAPGPATPNTEGARWPDVRGAHSHRLLTDTLSWRSVGNPQITFAATVPLALKQHSAAPRRVSKARSVPTEAVLANLRLFLAAQPGAATRRAYGRWPQRVVSVTTVENRFGTWSQALRRAREP